MASTNSKLSTSWRRGKASEDACFTAVAVSKIRFLDTDVHVPTGDAFTEIQFRLEAVLRNNSIGYKGGVRALPHEQWIFGSRSGQKAPIGRKDLLDNDSAREQFWLQAKRQAATMMCQLVQLVEEKRIKQYIDVDPYSLLEVLYLRHHAEAACNNFVRHQLFNALPDVNRPMTTDQSLIIVRCTKDSAMLRDAELVDSITLVDTVVEHLGLLSNACGPEKPPNATTTFRDLFAAYAYYFVWQVDFKASESAAPVRHTKRGPAAFQLCLEYLRNSFATDPESISLASMRPMSGFRFLMSREVQEEYRRWMAQARKNRLDSEHTGIPLIESGQHEGIEQGLASPNKQKGGSKAKVADATTPTGKGCKLENALEFSPVRVDSSDSMFDATGALKGCKRTIKDLLKTVGKVGESSPSATKVPRLSEALEHDAHVAESS